MVLCHRAPVTADKRLFTDAFAPAEFTARRANVMASIGDGVAILTGATDTPTYTKFRQNAQFFYLSGVEVPRAILLIDGRAKTSMLYIPPRNANAERSEGPVLVPGDQAVHLTGIERVLPRDEFSDAAKALAGRTVYTTYRGETRGARPIAKRRMRQPARRIPGTDSRRAKNGS